VLPRENFLEQHTSNILYYVYISHRSEIVIRQSRLPFEQGNERLTLRVSLIRILYPRVVVRFASLVILIVEYLTRGEGGYKEGICPALLTNISWGGTSFLNLR